MRKEFEELDEEKIFFLKDNFEIEQYWFTCEDRGLSSDYQQVLEKEIAGDYFSECENIILSFVDRLAEETDEIAGYICLHSNKIKRNPIARKCLLYKEFIQIERQGRMFQKALFSAGEIKTIASIGTKGIGTVMLLFEDYDMVLYLSDLNGWVLFDTDKYAEDVVKLGKECGLRIRHVRKKEIETIEEVYSRLENDYALVFKYKGRNYVISNDEYGILFEGYTPNEDGVGAHDEVNRIYTEIKDINDYIVDGERFADMFDKIEIIGYFDIWY